jgi:hypothetical protein
LRVIPIYRCLFVGFFIFGLNGLGMKRALAQDSSTPNIILSPEKQASAKHNDPKANHPYSPFNWRLFIELGDEAGGPVRYNTRFPTEAKDPNPASYYHTMAYAFTGLDRSFATGALRLGVGMRQDFAHQGFKDRRELIDGGEYVVNSVTIRNQSAMMGWIFGTSYAERLWESSLAGVFDLTHAKVDMARVDDSETFANEMSLASLSLRGGLQWNVLRMSNFALTIGPSIHIPVFSRVIMKRVSDKTPWFEDRLDLKNSASVGLGLFITSIL